MIGTLTFRDMVDAGFHLQQNDAGRKPDFIGRVVKSVVDS